jgi:NAD(P)-dependent dehydrogenase (short-subunit alcohol dehydrogenase family)
MNALNDIASCDALQQGAVAVVAGGRVGLGRALAIEAARNPAHWRFAVERMERASGWDRSVPPRRCIHVRVFRTCSRSRRPR